MVAALGASAYAAGIFHLFTHACFKALLFLAAGSVIIALHHEQDMRKMGNLWKYMPLTYVTFLIGALSLAAIPPFSGFYSKDAIIAAIQHTSRAGADYAYVCVVIGTFVTALYIFRAFFQVFHTQERMDASSRAHLKESPWVVCLPLLVLAIPSAMLGASLVEHLLYGTDNWFGNTLFVLPDHRQLLASDDHSMFALMREALHELPFWFALSGIAVAWIFFIRFPAWPGVLARRLSWLYSVLVNKYGFDAFNQRVFVRGTRSLSEWLFHVSDEKVIDNVFVNGSGRVVSWSSRLARRIQSGYLYHYALLMILALLAMSLWLVL
jgi:NADH-quinone oxidoreductase subunit L